MRSPFVPGAPDQDPMPDTVFEFAELKAYVGFGPDDEGELAALQGIAEQRLPELLDEFHETIRRHPDARAAILDPDSEAHPHRGGLAEWVGSLLSGPYDDTYARRHRGIEKAHAHHRLPQRYMLTAMNVVRRWFHDLCCELHHGDVPRIRACTRAIDRVLDIELALMLGIYRDEMLASMRRQERLATIGELAAGIQHELKNPLAAVGAAAFALRERRAVQADPRSRALLDHLVENVERASELVTDLLSFARLKEPLRAPVTVDELVESAAARIALPPRCRLTLDLDPALPAVMADKAQVRQILINLLQNAVEASTEGGDVRVTSRLVDGVLHVVVSDDGEGISPQDVERAFEPLWSTKPSGVGLGLSLSRHLAQANGATISLSPRPSGGTDATLVLKP
ncbi:protoglobin domain-containing protein [Myxococcota bacterium]|nr:protoglobin domain-containing protein [Myxococcota bacterium]